MDDTDDTKRPVLVSSGEPRPPPKRPRPRASQLRIPIEADALDYAPSLAILHDMCGAISRAITEAKRSGQGRRWAHEIVHVITGANHMLNLFDTPHNTVQKQRSTLVKSPHDK